jgi:hypothetical protein
VTKAIKAFIHAETSSPTVNTASRALLAAVVATAVAYLRSRGVPV